MSSHTASSARIAHILFAAIVAIAVGVPAAHAQVPTKDSDAQKVAVDYSDLNLSSKEGSRVLYHRLVAAARQVCPETGNLTELRQNRAAQQCITTSVERAVKQIRSPQFAQVAAARMR